MSKCGGITIYNAKGYNQLSTKTRNTAKMTWLFNTDQVVLKLMIDENVMLNQQYSSTQLPNGLEIFDGDGNAITNASFESITSTSHSFRYEGNRYDIINITSHQDGRSDAASGKGITHVIVEDGVTIVSNFFHNWKDLISVHLPSSVARIGQSSFNGCSSLTSINLPGSLKTIGPWTFCNCKSLSEINLPNSLTEIGMHAFAGCRSLSNITIPPSITRIEPSTFKDCSSLSHVIIPPSVTSIGECGFARCVRLKTIQLPSKLRRIEESIFKSCTSLKVIYTPSSALSKFVDIYNNIFQECNVYNLIILTDTDHFNYRGIPSITLHDILQCIHYLPNDIDIPPHQQLHTLQYTLQQRFPHIARRAQRSSLNLLHLLVYFPCVQQGDGENDNDDDDMYQSLLTLLTKCPQAMTAVDSSGRTPLHHVMTSTRHIMDSSCYELLLDRCPDAVVHLAIRSVAELAVPQSSSWRWDGVRDMVYAKMNALSVEDVESGLLPFMMVAEECDDVEGLSMVYELLCLNPGVLKEYN